LQKSVEDFSALGQANVREARIDYLSLRVGTSNNKRDKH
jgi:hypothetical protein